MNEMGAAWVLKNDYTTILLPGFEFNEIKGAINPRQIGLGNQQIIDRMKGDRCSQQTAGSGNL